jgi:hypothetical protein
VLTLAASPAKKAFKCLEGACYPKLLGGKFFLREIVCVHMRKKETHTEKEREREKERLSSCHLIFHRKTISHIVKKTLIFVFLSQGQKQAGCSFFLSFTLHQ